MAAKYSILSLFISSILYLTSYFYEYNGELDFPSFYHAKINSMIFPSTFPKNDSNDIKLWREVYEKQPRNISTFNIGVIDVWTDLYGIPGGHLMRIYNSNHSVHTPYNSDKPFVLLWLHDGGWTMGSAEQEDEICFKLAKETGFIIVSASYHLAPEYPFPQPVKDVTKSLQWVHENIEFYGAHPKKILIGGEGAGGNLATAVALRNLDLNIVDIDHRIPVTGLFIVHPPLAMNNNDEKGSSYEKYSNINRIMSSTQLNWLKSLYRSVKTIQPTDYTFAPLVASPQLLKLLPNTIIVIAKNCILYDENIKFARILKSKYVPVELLVYNTTIYGFFGRNNYPYGNIALKDASIKLLDIANIYPESYFEDDEMNFDELPPFPTDGFA